MPKVRTRFAPSPTGYLHIGSLRTALYSYLVAKQAGGQFVLRLEDTDAKRFVEGAAEAIYNGLKWARLQYDEGPDINGPYSPYVQSQRLELYKKYAQELLDKDLAYYCFCDAKTLENIRAEQTAKKQAPKYDRRCISLSKDAAEVRLQQGQPHVIRMKIPADRIIEINDLVRGKVSYSTNELDDQVILKSDGWPTYHLAVVVDDHLMEITHVTRTEEWLPSTPKHILLYEYFGWKSPRWAHLPLLLNTDKTKMSKRKGDVAVEDYIKKGYLPEAMVNYLAFLGWNPGTEKEIYSMEELLKDFSLERVHKAGAVFNIEKLNWYNSYYIKQLSIEKLTELCLSYLPPLRKGGKEGLNYKKIIALEQERLQTISEIGEHIAFFFKLPTYDKALLKWKEISDEEIKISLESSKQIISDTPDNEFTKEKLSKLLIAKASEFKNKGELLWPLRVALAGQKNSPPPFDILEILGKEESKKRIEGALLKLQS
ncbi:MAG: glutamate--tRNA ligase [Candidatus Buchananbacteria bacterium RIFCSPHIGHO2_01_FULL_39_8]|uniref:Glutamate--tRNA ligase n=1 Tax=Candidatus Buchananbacteria bacterium RIFCSPHIGHO2_01_FULL_39_8 TaxID=1797533 RepID=A0A1G1XVI6_9BACT|nr:MAG: glutamate--tRNA ligase [Candidatus Buchananbacteria bacterium RIFCSPHIGHO2_01_FULL_39_8]